MSRHKYKTAIPEPRRQRGGTFVVGLAAIGAAWVLTACDPDIVAPMLMAAIPSAAAAEKSGLPQRLDAARTPSAAAGAVYGEISSIEPIKSSSEVAGDNVPVGYRIHIRLEGGGTRSIERSELNGLDVGSRVRVQGGQLHRA